VRHGPLVTLLLLAAGLVAPFAVGAYWLRSEVFDTRRYVQTVTPLASNPAIDRAVAAKVTSELFAHADLAGITKQALPKDAQALSDSLVVALRRYTREEVTRFLRTPLFRRLWQQANRQAHEAFVDALDRRPGPLISDRGGIDIDLSSVVVAVRRELSVAGLHVFDEVKPELLQQHFVLATPTSIGRIRRAVEVLRALSVVLPILAILFVVLGIAASRRRVASLGWAGGAVAAAGAIGLGAVIELRSYFLESVVGPGVPRGAAVAFYDTVLASLRFDLKLVCVVGLGALAAAVVAMILSRGNGRPAPLG
jgi:hypothetical protein